MKGGNYSKQLFYCKRWHLCCLLFLVEACTTNSASNNKAFLTSGDSLKAAAIVKRAILQINEEKKTIHPGDLITRSGNDFTSESLQKLNQHDKTYSHCGLSLIHI